MGLGHQKVKKKSRLKESLFLYNESESVCMNFSTHHIHCMEMSSMDTLQTFFFQVQQKKARRLTQPCELDPCECIGLFKTDMFCTSYHRSCYENNPLLLIYLRNNNEHTKTPASTRPPTGPGVHN